MIGASIFITIGAIIFFHSCNENVKYVKEMSEEIKKGLK